MSHIAIFLISLQPTFSYCMVSICLGLQTTAILKEEQTHESTAKNTASIMSNTFIGQAKLSCEAFKLATKTIWKKFVSKKRGVIYPEETKQQLIEYEQISFVLR